MIARNTLKIATAFHDETAVKAMADDDQAILTSNDTDLRLLADHSAGVAAMAFSSDGCGAVHVAGERLRPNRNTATMA